MGSFMAQYPFFPALFFSFFSFASRTSSRRVKEGVPSALCTPSVIPPDRFFLPFFSIWASLLLVPVKNKKRGPPMEIPPIALSLCQSGNPFSYREVGQYILRKTMGVACHAPLWCSHTSKVFLFLPKPALDYVPRNQKALCRLNLISLSASPHWAYWIKLVWFILSDVMSTKTGTSVSGPAKRSCWIKWSCFHTCPWV